MVSTGTAVWWTEPSVSSANPWLSYLPTRTGRFFISIQGVSACCTRTCDHNRFFCGLHHAAVLWKQKPLGVATPVLCMSKNRYLKCCCQLCRGFQNTWEYLAATRAAIILTRRCAAVLQLCEYYVLRVTAETQYYPGTRCRHPWEK